MNNNKYLPIGTICTIKDNIKVMIAGYKFSDFATDFNVCDYIAVEYPIGLSYINQKYLFNHEDIINILFKGYEDEAFQNVNSKLKGNTSKEEETINPNLWNVFKNLEFNNEGTVIKAERNEGPEIEFDGFVEAPQFEFDENGVVVAINPEPAKKGNIELTTNNYEFDENGTVISVNNNEPTYQFNQNEVEIPLDNVESNISTSSIDTNSSLYANESKLDKPVYQFNQNFENSNPISDLVDSSVLPSITEPVVTVPDYQFDENGVVVAVTKEQPQVAKYSFDENGVVTSVNKTESTEPNYQFDENGIVINTNNAY